MDTRSDEELVVSYRQGEEVGLDILIRRYLAPIYRFLYRLTRDASLAEDLSQETFLKVWRHVKKFDHTKSFKTWLFVIAKNTAIDYFRKKRMLPVSAFEQEGREGDSVDNVEDPQPLPSELLERRELGEQIEAGLGTLPLHTRSVILLHDTEDLTFQEIADIMNEPMNTVKSRYRRGVLLLRAFLADRVTGF